MGDTTDRHIVVVGAVRDAETTLERAVATIGAALSGFASVAWYLVESDSSDGTVAVLDRLSRAMPNFAFVSHGELSRTVPQRTERIAFARNAGVDAFLTRPEFRHAEYMAVADLDEINFGLTRSAVDSCFIRSDWAAVFANQSKHYYDVWALRHPHWSPTDCWQSVQALVEEGIPHEIAWRLVVISRQIHLPSTSPWIEVDSAFGGFAIYRRQWLDGARYRGSVESGDTPVCEHVSYHEQIRAAGGRLFINPAMINAGWTEHTHAQQQWRIPFRAVKRLVERLLGSPLAR